MYFRPKSGDLRKKKVFANFGSAPGPKNSTVLVQIKTSPLQLLLPNPDGGLFPILEQKSASKAQKTCYSAYFAGQWGGLEASPWLRYCERQRTFAPNLVFWHEFEPGYQQFFELQRVTLLYTRMTRITSYDLFKVLI